MRRVDNLIAELQKFPADAHCYAYEGEIRGVVVVSADGRREFGYVLANEGPLEVEPATVFP